MVKHNRFLGVFSLIFFLTLCSVPALAQEYNGPRIVSVSVEKDFKLDLKSVQFFLNHFKNLRELTVERDNKVEFIVQFDPSVKDGIAILNGGVYDFYFIRNYKGVTLLVWSPIGEEPRQELLEMAYTKATQQ